MKPSPPNSRPTGPTTRSSDTPARVSTRFDSLAALQDAFLKAQSDVWVEDCIADRSTGTLTLASLKPGQSALTGGGRSRPDDKLRR